MKLIDAASNCRPEPRNIPDNTPCMLEGVGNIGMASYSTQVHLSYVLPEEYMYILGYSLDTKLVYSSIITPWILYLYLVEKEHAHSRINSTAAFSNHFPAKEHKHTLDFNQVWLMSIHTLKHTAMASCKTNT